MTFRKKTTSERATEASEALYTIAALLLRRSIDFSWWVMKSAYSAVWSYEPDTTQAMFKHKKNTEKLLEEFHQKRNDGQLALGGKTTSYLFRSRHQQTTKLNYLSHFNTVLAINTEEKIAHVGGMTTFYDLAKESLKIGLLPAVTPELRGITVGGAVAGMAIESSSFKYGLLHNSITEMEILTGKGEILTCQPDNKHSHLFYGMPNSYATMGYAISAKIKLIPVSPFVKLKHTKFSDPETLFRELEKSCRETKQYDFIDATIFSPTQMVMTTAQFVTWAPYTSNYKQKGIYYKSIQKNNEDYLTTWDYVWRWDADSFWSTKANDGKPTILQQPWFRHLFGEIVLRTDRLKMLEKMAREFHENVMKFIHALLPPEHKPEKYHESIVQDIGIPIENCAAFIKWLDKNIGIYPIWVCPILDPYSEKKYPLWKFGENKLTCDIGIFGNKSSNIKHEKGFFNRQLEAETKKQNGMKSLYSQSYFNKDDFERIYYGGDAYSKLKEEYDPDNRFPTLYEKCVLNR
jgi:FAD/FMN-containing dehydrogenase